MIFEILAYITGALIVINGLFIFIFPQRNKTMIFKLTNDVMTALNGIFIYYISYSPLILVSVGTCTIGIFRDIVFGLREKYKTLNHIAWPIAFATINLCSLFLTYTGFMSVMPVVGTAVSCMTLYFYDQRIAKSGAIFCQTVYVIYFAVLISSTGALTIFSLIAASTTLLGSIIGLIYILVHKNKNSNEKIMQENQNNEMIIKEAK